MVLEPRTDGLYRTIGKQLEWFSCFEIADQGAIARPTSVRPIINANDLRRFLNRVLNVPHKAQQAIRTDWHTKVLT